MPKDWSKAVVAEAVGTFALIFVGVLSIAGVDIAGAVPGTTNLAAIGLAHGLTIAVMVAALGAISGGHFNPAVTFAFVLTGRMKMGVGLFYWLAQLAGAVLAAVLISLMYGPAQVATGTPQLNETVPFASGVVTEAVATFFLVLVVFGTAVDARAPKSVYPLAIGLTVALDIMAIGPLTGGAMNPARTFGPAVASGTWANHLVYWAGPLLGAACAAMLYQLVLADKTPAEPPAETA